MTDVKLALQEKYKEEDKKEAEDLTVIVEFDFELPTIH